MLHEERDYLDLGTLIRTPFSIFLFPLFIVNTKDYYYNNLSKNIIKITKTEHNC